MPIGLDATLPLQSDAVEGFYTLNQTVKENTKQKVKMLMLTAPGERMMVPTYGVGLKAFLFENDPEVAIIERIQDQVTRFLPGISIVSLEVEKGGPQAFARIGHEHSLIVKFVYLIDGINLVDSIKLVETQTP